LRDEYGIDQKAKVILFVGQINRIKNVSLLIQAFKKLSAKRSDLLLLIVGEGPRREFMQNLVNRLDLRRKVRFIGRVPYNNMFKVYSVSDVLALPSHYENSPSVIKEALACGIPVVSTDVGDAKDIITDPRIGQIVESRTPESFAKGLITAIDIIERDLERVKRECRRKAELYDFRRIAKQHVELYKTVLGNVRI
jgi:glycosyltransferase involved in cell wall biosynthesis